MSTDPFGPGEFEGSLSGPGVPDGKRKALLRVDANGVHARTAEGLEHSLPWRGMRLERGGASAALWMCHAGKHSVQCEHPDFARSLESLGGNEIADALAKAEGTGGRFRGMQIIGCLFFLALTGWLLSKAPAAFRGLLDTTTSALPWSVDEKLGELAVESMDPGGPEVDDEQVRAALETMLARLQPHAAREGVEFELRVIESEIANAYALPGGPMTVFTGLLAEATRAEMVAGVLAHEMAHVTLRHGVARIVNSVGTLAALQLLLGDLDGILGVAAELFTLATVNDYSQDQERAADLEGARMLRAAGLDPLALAEFFEQLEAEHGDVPEHLAWLSSHPAHAERVEAIREELAKDTDEVEYAPLVFDGFEWEEVQERLR